MDKEILENYLTLTKSICKLYCDGYIESANKKVTSVMMGGLNKNLDLQQDLFQKMSEDGLYKIQNVSPSEISKTYTKLTSQQNQQKSAK